MITKQKIKLLKSPYITQLTIDECENKIYSAQSRYLITRGHIIFASVLSLILYFAYDV